MDYISPQYAKLGEKIPLESFHGYNKRVRVPVIPPGTINLNVVTIEELSGREFSENGRPLDFEFTWYEFERQDDGYIRVS